VVSIETRELTIRFGGHVAVNAVSCAFQEGTLTAIVGPNGAGKTTYFNLISGQLPSTSGQIFHRGEDITSRGVPERAMAGIGRAFQLTNLFPALTVLENARLAVQARVGVGMDLWRTWRSRRDVLERAERVLESVSLAHQAKLTASQLSHGDQRKLEVALLIAMEPAVVMLDEPTAGMSAHEVPDVLKLVRELKSRRDTTILLVEHKMDVIRELADRVIVLHNGTLLADGDPEEVIASSVVQEAYLGVPVGASYEEIA